jgi:hypothetical protein
VHQAGLHRGLRPGRTIASWSPFRPSQHTMHASRIPRLRDISAANAGCSTGRVNAVNNPFAPVSSIPRCPARRARSGSTDPGQRNQSPIAVAIVHDVNFPSARPTARQIGNDTYTKFLTDPRWPRSRIVPRSASQEGVRTSGL